MTSDMSQMAYLSQFITGGGLAWIQVALLVCLFAAMLFRPERIRNPSLMKWAGLLLALSVIAPPVLWLGVRFLLGDTSVLRPPRSQPSGDFGVASMLFALQMISGPVLLGLGVICGLFALCPRPGDARPAQPPRHPLE